MSVIKINAFGGMIPATDDRLLPENAGALAQNTYLYTGQLVGMVSPKYIRDLANPGYGKAFRIPKNYFDAEHIEDSVWMEFSNIDTDVIRSPVTGDQYDRYYWASPSGPPQVNSAARIIAGLPSYTLGVPGAHGPPIIASIVGGVGINETRSYVVTWVTAFGEEGMPSLPVIGTGRNDATWTITLPAPPPGDVTTYNLSKARIYRTVTATTGTADFFFVTELPIATLTYADNNSNVVVSSNEILASIGWSGPPEELEGLVSMPNGMLAGWVGSDLWFSEPYRPHAWPSAYTNSVEYPIVGLGVINQTLVICTAGYPMVATGIHPDSVSLSKLSSFEPCMSRGSILSVPEGVFYASPNGLVLVANGAASLVSEGLIAKDEWNNFNKVATLRATRMGNAYYAFGSARVGFAQTDAFQNNMVQLDDFGGAYKGMLVDSANPRIAYNTLTNPEITTNVFNDAWSGETLIIRNDKLYRIDLADRESVRDTAVWRSKVFQSPDKKNFAVFRVYYEIPPWAEETYKDRIPPMTGAVTSGVTMSADNAAVGGEAWRAGSDNPLQMWRTTSLGAFPHALTVDFGSGDFIASKYSFMGAHPSDPGAPNRAPKSWTFQGSNNGTTWVVLDTRVDQALWLPGEERVFDIPSGMTTLYNRYRIVVTQTFSGTDTITTIGTLHIAAASHGYVRVYADDRLILTRELRRSSELMRLPSGFKADYWQIEFETVARINSVQMATSSKELLKA